jgi:preprotein translocase subunit SecA
MGRRRKSGKRGQQPDDYFAKGPLELARFGRVIIGRMNASEQQHAEMQARLAASYPEVVAKINGLVAAIAARVARLPPLRLLHRAWWEHSAAVLLEGSDPSAQTEALRMIDYVQSVIVSTPPAPAGVDDISEEEWQALKADVSALFQTLTFSYPMAATARRKAESPDLDMALEEFQVRAEMLWANVRGRRYQLHERQALLDTLLPHSDILDRLFGIDAKALIDELDKILAKLTRGLHDLFVELEEVRDRTLDRMDEVIRDREFNDFESIRDKVFEDTELREANARLAGELIGYDLFDVERNTNLPPALLKELSYAPGEEKEFFAPGEFPGWPLRVWPVMKRPFIRLDGRIYCFDMFSLFDNFYRVLQRAIFRLAPEYRPAWNERQKAVSEALPFDYLKHLLPAATTYRPVYYRWRIGDGPAQWHEADGLLIYDDHLFVIEVKAGAFTYTSPATDLPAHIESLRNLVLHPARQGSRFVDYLESAEEVTIYDAAHSEIGRLRRSSFRHVSVCAVTLDPFTELAARAQHLRELGIDVGSRPVWVLSVDDLRAYVDLFDDPLTFLHYAEQRIAAASSELVELTDELDHFGMYLSENHYVRYAAELRDKTDARLNFNGYRADIDAYFSAIIHGETVGKPRQKMPPRIAEIVRHLSVSSKPGRSMLASFLLDAAGDHRDKIAEALDQALDDHRTLGRVRPFSSYGEHAFTLFTSSPLVPRDAAGALNFTRDVVAQSQDDGRLLIEIECDEHGVITDVHWATVGLAGLSMEEAARHREAGRRLAQRRVELAQGRGKIRVNAQCPCGSGKKYKRCHGRR